MISKSKIRGETRKLKVGLKKKGVTSATTRRMSYAIMSALLIFTLASSSILSSVLLVVHAQEEDEDEGVVDNNNEDLMTSTSSSSSSSNPGLISSENQDNQGNNDSMAGDDLEETSSDEIEGESSSGDPGELSTSSDDCPEGQQRDANGNCIIAPIESTNLATTSTFSNGANNATATNDLANQSSLVHEIGPNANIDRCSGLQRPQLIDPRPPEVKLAECRINEKYEQLRNNGLDLGEPTAIVTASQNGNGVFYRDFQSGSIYFIPDRGTFETHGAIWEKYKEKDRENGFLELPKEGTRTLPENRGLVQIFDGGVIYWSGDTGAHELHNGPILNTYARLGYEKSQLGFPITDESPALREGKYNHFQSGAIYWAPELDGAYAVYGPIYEKWKSIGWEHSELGFPISDTGQPPFGDVDSPGMDSVSNGDQYSRFQEGAISWSASTGQTYIHLNPLKFAITFNKIHVYESHDYIGCANWHLYATVNEHRLYKVLHDFCVDQDNTYDLSPVPLFVVTVPRDGQLNIGLGGCDGENPSLIAGFDTSTWPDDPDCEESLGYIDETYMSNGNWGLNTNQGYGYHQIESVYLDEYTDYWIDFTIQNCEVATGEACDLAPGKYHGLRLQEGVRYYPGEPDRSELRGCTFC